MKTYNNDMGYGTLNGVRVDGSAASGNWGHVGRPGEVGGSASGGGSAFRGESKTKWMKSEIGQYCSQAKIRANTMQKLKSTSARVRNQGVKHAQMFNMEQKSFKNVTKFDPAASKNILKNPKQSNVSKKFGVQATKGMRDYEFSNKHTLTAQQAATMANGPTQANTLKSLQTKAAKAAAKAAPQASAPKPAQASAPKSAPKPTSNTSTSSSNSQQNQGSSSQLSQPKNTPSTQTQTGRPTGNANYQKAIAAAGDATNEKAFYKEAKQNGHYQRDSRGGKYSDTRSSDNGNIQKLVNYMGLTEPPTLVDSSTFDKLAKGREDQVMFRGTSSSEGEDQFKTGKCNRMGGIAYGTGVYFGGSKDGTFRTSCGYGQDIKALPKADAKILEVDTSGRDSSGKTWRNRDSNGNTQWTSAIISGYDAVRIKGAGGTARDNSGSYVVVWNRAAFIVEK